MRRKVWLRIRRLAGKVAWVEEAESGLCIGPSVGLRGVHYTYHDTGRRHLTIAPRIHRLFRQVNDARLESVTDHRNVGGFGIDWDELKWEERDSLPARDLVLECDSQIRRDLGITISLHVATREREAAFREAIRSSGAKCHDTTLAFDLKFFPNLVGIVQVQYHTTE